MKKVMFIALLFTLISIMWASQTIPVSANGTGLNLTNNTSNGFNLHYTVGQLQTTEINTVSGVFDELTISDYTSTNFVGLPKLPLMRKIIAVPVGAQVNVIVTNTKEKTYSLDEYQIHYPLMPFQPSLSKSQKPEDVPFEYNTSSYNTDSFTDTPVFQTSELGYLRGVRLFAIDFIPVKYNPVSKQIDVISEVDIRVNFVGADMAATEALRAKTSSVAFEPLYQKTILNYISDERSTLNRYPLTYLILTPTTFQTTLQPFIDMKVRQGYKVVVETVGTGGQIAATTVAIKAYLQGLWDNATTANPCPSYCLIVGDTPQIPSNTGLTSTGHVTDVHYFRLQGTDYMPEMYYGRFSATTVAELQPQIDKSLQFEQFTMPDPSYLSEVVMIAGYDATYGPTHGNGQINYGTQNYFNGLHGITSHTYLFPSTNTVSPQILTNMSSGVGFVNYTAHGDVDQWYEPYISISNVNSLTNANKYFVAIGNCCLTNHFDTATCFGEAMLRAANKGAVAYIGGTNSSYWNEDYWWAVGNKPVVGSGTPWAANQSGVYDLLYHEHQEAFEDWVYGMGPMVFSGNLAVVRAASAQANYYWEIYSIMGDPALQPYMGLPAVNTVEVPAAIFLGTSTVQISAEPYSYVAVSMNNVLHGAGLVDQTGVISLAIDPFTAPGNAQIVVSRSNRRPFSQSVQVIPLSGPYITVGNFTISDGNNHQADAGETFNINLTLNNVGSLDAEGITATLSTTDPYTVINTATSTPISIAANGTATITQAFNMTALSNTPDQHVVPLTITVTDGADSTWVSHVNVTVSAPSIQLGTPVITEVTGNGNGVSDPGETVQFSIPITNTGHGSTAAIHAVVVSNNPVLTITNGTTDIAAGLGVNQSSSLVCTIAISSTATTGTVLPIGVSIHSGNFDNATSSVMQIGLVGDGFESGNLTAQSWLGSGSANWTVVSGTNIPHSGTYCIKSGTISNNQTSAIQLTMDIASAGNISFWRKVSSEANYDKLFFYIDGSERENWSGTVAWAQSTYPVTQGVHVFKWAYIKDTSQASGTDCAWVDDVAFPPTGNNSAPMFFTETTALDFGVVEVNTPAIRTFMIQNLGNQTLTIPVTIPADVTLTVGDQSPQTLSLTPGQTLTVTLTIHPTQTGAFNEILGLSTNDPFVANTTINLTGSVYTGNNDPSALPTVTALQGNYPNPFNPSTYIAFSLKQTENVSVIIYNVKGQVVKTLVSGRLDAGNHRFLWEGKDNSNHQVSTGMYLYRFQAGDVSSTKKMMLIK